MYKLILILSFICCLFSCKKESEYRKSILLEVEASPRAHFLYNIVSSPDTATCVGYWKCEESFVVNDYRTAENVDCYLELDSEMDSAKINLYVDGERVSEKSWYSGQALGGGELIMRYTVK